MAFVVISQTDDDDVGLNVLRCRADVLGTHSNFHKRLVECCFTSTETVDLLGTGARDVHLDFHTALELCFHKLLYASALFT